MTQETKRQKFIRLAEIRTTKAMKAILALKKLSNRSAYEWTVEDVRMIVAALKDTLDSVTTAYNKALEGRKPDEVRFTFASSKGGEKK